MKLYPELESLEMLAQIILTAARTAPKGKGIDDIITCLLSQEEQADLADKMEELGQVKGLKFLFRDAQNVRDADAITLIGLKASGVSGLDCGACGFATCKEMLEHEKVQKEFLGPQCMIKYLDLGIAVGSAAAKAKDLCIDNRVLYSAGAAACYFKMIDADVAMGLPLSVKGKNIFFDRQSTRKNLEMK
ncbi:MAG: ferredoxin domain-containing protein [Methanosarcina sp.]